LPQPTSRSGDGTKNGLPSPLRGGAGGGVSSNPTPVPNIIVGQPVAAEKLARAKELRRIMTPAERTLWSHLRADRLAGFHFRRQQVIDGFIVDFYCHSAALIVEVDGPIHDEQIEADTQRDGILTVRGFRIIRFRNEQVENDLPIVLMQIERLCRRH
jgi:very-short-patch-repair endonuclease